MKPFIIQFFKYLEKKEGQKAPLKVKLLNPKEFKLTPDDLKVKGNLDLSNTKITSLPDNLKVKGYLNLNSTKITFLPDNLKFQYFIIVVYETRSNGHFFYQNKKASLLYVILII